MAGTLLVAGVLTAAAGPAGTATAGVAGSPAAGTATGAPVAPAPAPAGDLAGAAAAADVVPVTADAYALVDVATGRVLAARDLHGQRLPASTVKIVTALTALRLIPADEPVVVSARAAAKPAMKIGMLEGERWNRDDAIAAMMMVSANDASYALAEQASGSVEAFAEAMAETGRLLGLRDSTFADPAGFDDPVNAEIGPSRMSVYDLAVAARAALADPTLARIVGTARYEFTGPSREHTLTNHSKMLRSDTPRFYEGTDGVKTGYTRRAQGTFVASATREGRTLVAVMLGNVDIYTPVQQLLDAGFAQGPAAPGIGVTLPAVNPAAFTPAAALAPPASAATDATDATDPDATDPDAAASGAAASGAAASGDGAADGGAAPLGAGVAIADDADSGWGVLRTALLVVLAVAAALGARVAQVQRRRARRAAARRAAAAPDEWSAAPDEWSAAPDEWSAAPDEWSAAPDEWSAPASRPAGVGAAHVPSGPLDHGAVVGTHPWADDDGPGGHPDDPPALRRLLAFDLALDRS